MPRGCGSRSRAASHDNSTSSSAQGAFIHLCGIWCSGPNLGLGPDLGYRVAAFEAEGYQPRDELVYLAYTTPGRMVARFAMRGEKTLFLFVFTTDHMSGADPQNESQAKTTVGQVFGGAGWECPEILRKLDQASDLYFDRASQIIMDHWSKGRV